MKTVWTRAAPDQRQRRVEVGDQRVEVALLGQRVARRRATRAN